MINLFVENYRELCVNNGIFELIYVSYLNILFRFINKISELSFINK